MQPSAASVSRSLHRSDCEKAVEERLPPPAPRARGPPRVRSLTRRARPNRPATRRATARARCGRSRRGGRRGAAPRGSRGCRQRDARPPCSTSGRTRDWGRPSPDRGRGARSRRSRRGRTRLPPRVRRRAGARSCWSIPPSRCRGSWHSRRRRGSRSTAAAPTRRPRRSSDARAARRARRHPRTAPGARCASPASTRCRGGRARAPR